MPVPVRHRKADEVILDCGRERKVSLAQRRLTHCIASVEQQIEDNLLQLNTVAQHERGARRERARHGDTARYDFTVCEVDDFANHIIQVDRLKHGGLLPQEPAQPVDDGAGPSVVVDDVVDGGS